MRKKIKKWVRKWLGIDEDWDRLTDAVLKLSNKIKENEDGGTVFKSSTVKEGSFKELVYEMMYYLKLRPRETFYQEVSSQEYATKRKFWIEKTGEQKKLNKKIKKI